jgi:hypothetical protein
MKEDRPAVQVGDPFREKLLLEACLELLTTDAVAEVLSDLDDFGFELDRAIIRTLLHEVGRGQDYFRSAVIEALGDHGATYAVEPLLQIARLGGPLQIDAAIDAQRFRRRFVRRAGFEDALAPVVQHLDARDPLVA